MTVTKIKEEFIRCYKCDENITQERCLLTGILDEEVMCGKCFKSEHGDDMYFFVKNMIDSR